MSAADRITESDKRQARSMGYTVIGWDAEAVTLAYGVSLPLKSQDLSWAQFRVLVPQVTQ